jgi:hypothetical protein
MNDIFQKDEDFGVIVDEPDLPKKDAPPNFSNPAEFIEWILKNIGDAKIAHEILVRYASTFKLAEGRKKFLLYFFMIPIAYLVDNLVGAILLILVFTLLIGTTIAILRGLNVIPELVAIFKLL